MNDGTFDGNPTKIIDYSGAGNTKRLTYTWKTCSGGLETFYGLRTNSAYGNGAEVYYPGFPDFFFLYWGRLQGTPTTTITNGTYYLKATHDFGSGNIVRQYYYGTDVIINDLSGTREFEIYTENSNPSLDVMVENGTRYQLNSFFNSTKVLSNNFLVIQRTAPKSAVYIYAPTVSWAFENGTGYSSMKTTVSDVKLISATVVLGEFNAEPLIDLLTAFKYYGDNLVGETMPVSFVGVVEAYKSVKELYGKAKWGDVAWKTTYDKCLSDSDVKLVMHDSPETNNITSWALTSKKLDYAILGQPGTSSTTKIYCGLRGEPIAIYAVNGPLTESYNASTKILALNVTHQSSTRILVYWKFPSDVNDNGIIDVFDLALMGKAFGATPGSLNWDEDCDINGDEIVSETDLSTAEKDYGKSTP